MKDTLHNAVLAMMLAAASTPFGVTLASPGQSADHAISTKEMHERFGIEVQGIRPTAGGYMLDFRYKVVDSEKAAGFLGHHLVPQLVDERRNARLITPAPPKVGPMRQTGAALKDGRTYFVFFANPGKAVKAGDPVAVVLGDVTLRGLTVN
ncbi:MAG: hypothetical protein M0R77_05180 [Gammaproteobacteria bacterium]|nr:hypothetical protein [Gammaproteobacteria bacterium]